MEPIYELCKCCWDTATCRQHRFTPTWPDSECRNCTRNITRGVENDSAHTRRRRFMTIKKPSSLRLICATTQRFLKPLVPIFGLLMASLGHAQLADYSALEAQLASALSKATGSPISVTRITATPASELLEVGLSNGMTLYTTPS